MPETPTEKAKPLNFLIFVYYETIKYILINSWIFIEKVFFMLIDRL